MHFCLLMPCGNLLGGGGGGGADLLNLVCDVSL